MSLKDLFKDVQQFSFFPRIDSKELQLLKQNANFAGRWKIINDNNILEGIQNYNYSTNNNNSTYVLNKLANFLVTHPKDYINHVIKIERMPYSETLTKWPLENGYNIGTRLFLYINNKGKLILPNGDCFTKMDMNILSKYWLYGDKFLETETFKIIMEILYKMPTADRDTLKNLESRLERIRERSIYAQSGAYAYAVIISNDKYKEKTGFFSSYKDPQCDIAQIIGGKKKTRKVASINKKDVLGKQRNIYKFVGNKKEYIKYKNKFILLKKYKEIQKKKTKAKK